MPPTAPPAPPARMRAVVYDRYGPPEVLRCEDAPVPAPGDGEVLLAVHAAGVNPREWHFVRGTPYALRPLFGLARPRARRLGVDAAGVVAAVGRGVTRLAPGDAVFGTARGAFAEYACAAEAALVPLPPAVAFAQAAAVPTAALTALQGLRAGGLPAGQPPTPRVLVNGAAGGVGTFAVQLARTFGAAVTGVCSTSNTALVRSLGAEHVVDYTRDDVTAAAEHRGRYDLLLDCVGNRPLAACARVLRPGGTYVAVGGPDGRWVGPLPRMLAVRARPAAGGRRRVPLVTRRSADDLRLLRDLLAAGRVTPVLDRRYALADAAAAVRYVEAGHARGKVILTVHGAA
ncbi:NADPH:quinone reductase [Gemmatimonadetes bacterium T265]|nr:NADPH:quinone reductase [Gemmatimonadetes bacterium T265]